MLAAAGVVAALQFDRGTAIGCLLVLVPPLVGVALVLRGRVKLVFQVVMVGALLDVVALLVVA
jgi:hypothetical protein